MREVEKNMKNNMLRKGLVLAIMVLFVGLSICPNSFGISEKKESLPFNKQIFSSNEPTVDRFNSNNVK